MDNLCFFSYTCSRILSIITTAEAAVLACSRTPACILAVVGGAKYVLDSLTNPDLNSTLNNESTFSQRTEEGTEVDKLESCEEEVIPVLDDPTCIAGGDFYENYQEPKKRNNKEGSCNVPDLSIFELTERIKLKQDFYRARKNTMIIVIKVEIKDIECN